MTYRNLLFFSTNLTSKKNLLASLSVISLSIFPPYTQSLRISATNAAFRSVRWTYCSRNNNNNNWSGGLLVRGRTCEKSKFMSSVVFYVHIRFVRSNCFDRFNEIPSLQSKINCHCNDSSYIWDNRNLRVYQITNQSTRS